MSSFQLNVDRLNTVIARDVRQLFSVASISCSDTLKTRALFSSPIVINMPQKHAFTTFNCSEYKHTNAAMALQFHKNQSTINNVLWPISFFTTIKLICNFRHGSTFIRASTPLKFELSCGINNHWRPIHCLQMNVSLVFNHAWHAQTTAYRE